MNYDSIDNVSCKRFFTGGNCEEFFYFLEDKFGWEYTHGLNYIILNTVTIKTFYWRDKCLI